MTIQPTTTWTAPRERLVVELAEARGRIRALTRALDHYGIDTTGLVEPDDFRAEFEATLDRIDPTPRHRLTGTHSGSHCRWRHERRDPRDHHRQVDS